MRKAGGSGQNPKEIPFKNKHKRMPSQSDVNDWRNLGSMPGPMEGEHKIQ